MLYLGDLEHIMANASGKLTGIVIAKNEQARIASAIDSLAFADEILVIDNGSTDKTADIAQKKGARVIHAPSASFGELRNIGKKEARGKWIVYLDADEVIPSLLATEITKTSSQDFGTHQAQDQVVCFFIRRNNFYLGHQWRTTDRMQRLFYKDALIRWQGDLHETPEVIGKTSELTHPLDHHTHRTLEEMLEKTNVWSNTEAQLRLKAAHPAIVPWRLLRVSLTGFWHSFIREGGWKMGTVGFIESMYQGFSLFITYAKLWELQQKQKVL
jgi:glycosyltransferase involved in cell wall biosynthesis